jgi:c-di-GMP-binding flagellar brake protein YcgR
MEVSSLGCQLQSTRSATGFSFQDEEPIRVKFTEEGTLYAWDGKVDKISGTNGRSATISIVNVGVTVDQRNSMRLNALVPFSFMIVDAAATEIISDQPVKSKTRNISAGGLAFKSDLPLRTGDQLQLSIEVAPTQSVNVLAWVVRCDTGQEDSKTLVAVEFLQPGEMEQGEIKKLLTGL